MALYGFILLMAGLAYYLLAHTLSKYHGRQSTLSIAIGNDRKGKLSVLIYAIGIALCFVHPALGFSLYVFVAAIWFIPDKRIEKKFEHTPGD